MGVRQLALNFLMFSYFPKNKGMGAGIALIGSSTSVIFWSLFMQYFVNPNKIDPEIIVYEEMKRVKYYSEEQQILQNVPSFFTTSYCIILGLALITYF